MECLDQAISIWNAVGIDGNDPPQLPRYAASILDPCFVHTCTLRAFEYSWMAGHRGPCFVHQMIQFWDDVQDHGTLLFGSRHNLGKAKSRFQAEDDVGFCFVSSLTVPCTA